MSLRAQIRSLGRRPSLIVHGMLALLLLLTSACLTLPSQIPASNTLDDALGPKWSATHYFPRFPTPEKLYALEIPDGYPESGAITLVSLQGIVNRESPVVYLVFDRFSQFWLDEIQKATDMPVLRMGSIAAGLDFIVREFRTKIRGLVVYDPSVPDTLNVATTIAGLEDRLIVEPSQVNEFTDKYALSDVLDLRTYVTAYGWNNENEGRLKLYKWVYDNLWSRAERRIIGVANPGPPVSKWRATIGVREYIVALRLVTLYLSADDTAQAKLYGKFLSTAPAAAPIFGWASTEGPTVSLVSSYGHWVPVLSHPFDEFSVVPSNLSVLSGVASPPVKYVPRLDPQRIMKTLEPGVYVTAYVTDGDNIGTYDYSLGANQWDVYKNSDVPIGWTINPVLIDIAPIIWNFYVNTAGPQTTLVSGAGAAGYMDPVAMNRSDLLRYLDYARVYWNATGIRTAQIGTKLPLEYERDYSDALSPLGLFDGYGHLAPPGMLPFPLGKSNVETAFHLAPNTGLPVVPNFYSFSFSASRWKQEEIMASLAAAAGREMASKKLTFRAVGLPINGQAISDSTSQFGSSVVAYSKQELRGPLVFGPYATVPAGSHTASVGLRVGDTNSLGTVGTIDVVARLGNTTDMQTIAQMDLPVSQFHSTRWQEFNLSFILNKTATELEIRVHFKPGTVDLYCDHTALLSEGGWPAYGSHTAVFVAISLVATGDNLGPGTTYDPQRVLDLLRSIAVLDPRVHLLATDEFLAAINPTYMLDLAKSTLSKANESLISLETMEQLRSAEDNFKQEKYDKSLELTRRAISGTTESLEIGVNPAGSGIVDPGIGTYLLPKGSSITATQSPSDGYKFDYWLLDGARAGSDPNITLRLDVPHGLTAVYEVSATAVSTPSTNTATISVLPSPVPGFPVESILAGLAGGIALLTLLGRRRKQLIFA